MIHVRQNIDIKLLSIYSPSQLTFYGNLSLNKLWQLPFKGDKIKEICLEIQLSRSTQMAIKAFENLICWRRLTYWAMKWMRFTAIKGRTIWHDSINVPVSGFSSLISLFHVKRTCSSAVGDMSSPWGIPCKPHPPPPTEHKAVVSRCLTVRNF